MSPRESHHIEETLSTAPLGQFQAQRSDNTTTTNSIAHFHTYTPSQSEIFSDHNNSGTINNKKPEGFMQSCNILLSKNHTFRLVPSLMRLCEISLNRLA